jgi:dolichol-phosphate mannosyltransferase
MLRRAAAFVQRTQAALPPVAQRFLIYALCGVAAVTLDFAVYSLLLRLGVHYQVANLIGATCGLLLSFTLNRTFTFRVLDAPWRRFAIFAAIGSVGYLLGSATLHVLVEIVHLNAYIAKALSMIIVVVSQFSLNSIITFKPRT